MAEDEMPIPEIVEDASKMLASGAPSEAAEVLPAQESDDSRLAAIEDLVQSIVAPLEAKVAHLFAGLGHLLPPMKD